MSHLWDRLTQIEGVVESESMFVADDALWMNGTEIAHRHGAHLEVRLTRQVIRSRADLVAPEFVARRSRSSDWIVIDLSASPEAETLAHAAVDAAAEAHRPPDGTTAAPPPTGPELERRRRLH